ncbi:cadmium-translocating P-type ATPase [Ferroglobus placidus DSM 10642]|uniref:Cadmium-translocating P-type ATPase n=1 Tax=Ferroglobus placidus (strain DSM 10642 / AEDII12DO) TaxID=589924 RepID=D3S1U6_FERPA|nr:heavy metal translocating P-type ATPase [Ferroglobus placidus]ADC64403.1 cadmium-translocating P-type ATPase [Ferroglobus placidus DSM 10642]
MKRYKLKNLDCATCALEIEEELKKQDGVKFAAVNFATSELVVDAEDHEKVVETVKKVEQEVELESIEKEEELDVNKKREIGIILTSAILFAIGTIFNEQLHAIFPAEYVVLLTSYIIVGWKIIWKGITNLKNKVVFDENFLLTIATLGAIAIHELPEAVAVMLFFRVGEFLQDLAVDKSRRAIKALVEIKPTFANLKVNGEVRRVKPEEVKVGDLIVVKPGEKIPLDGVIVEGNSVVDTSALTGESKPRDVAVGDEVLSGMVNISGLIVVKVTRSFSESAVSKILKLVEEASSRKAKAERFITRFARYYTPAVIALAAVISTIPPIAFNEPFSPWIYRALVLLVISCPCALVVSIPLSYFASIGKAARIGVLVKGSNYVDRLTSTRIFAFDKTGTLTKGSFKVVGIVTKNGFKEEEVLKLAAIAEKNSNHPIAKSIVEAYGEVRAEVKSHKEIPGRGVVAELDGTKIAVGNDAMMHELNVEHECFRDETVVHVAVNGKYAGYIIVSDEPKEDAKKAIEELKKSGCKVVMVTGDSKRVAERIAKELGVDDFYAELMPWQKVEVIEELKKKYDSVAFVGDGINDAPVIARADVGIAMGAMGSDAAIEIADVVVMDDKPSKVSESLKLSKRTQRIVWQNITFALAVKGIFIALGSLGLATMWEAVFADVGVTLIAILNSMRLLR